MIIVTDGKHPIMISMQRFNEYTGKREAVDEADIVGVVTNTGETYNHNGVECPVWSCYDPEGRLNQAVEWEWADKNNILEYERLCEE